MKKICVVIGSRANYSSARSIMRAIQEQDGVELRVALGASALLNRFGNLEETLKADGFPIHSKYYMVVEGETPVTMAKSAGMGIQELATIFDNDEPDMVLVVGDRFDVMSTVIAARYMNIRVAHTMGGERSGTIDESIRHAITKFSHLHFPANEDSRQRIIGMGENPDHVFTVGCPRIDYVMECLGKIDAGEQTDNHDFFAKYGGVGGTFDLGNENFLLVAQHPVTTEFGSNRHYMDEILGSLSHFGLPTIMIWPNADAGSEEISKSIRVFRENNDAHWLHLFINLPLDVYVRLMKNCACMVGNSSSAIREGEAIGVPAVDIGSRQNMRLKGINIAEVPPDRDLISKAIRKQMEHGPYQSEHLYGDGTAGVKIARILSETTIENTGKINFF